MLSTNDVNIGIIMFDTDTNVLSYCPPDSLPPGTPCSLTFLQTRYLIVQMFLLLAARLITPRVQLVLLLSVRLFTP